MYVFKATLVSFVYTLKVRAGPARFQKFGKITSEATKFSLIQILGEVITYTSHWKLLIWTSTNIFHWKWTCPLKWSLTPQCALYLRTGRHQRAESICIRLSWSKPWVVVRWPTHQNAPTQLFFRLYHDKQIFFNLFVFYFVPLKTSYLPIVKILGCITINHHCFKDSFNMLIICMVSK